MNHRRPLAEINITPLVDVLLILIAALLMLTPQLVQRLPVDLPRTGLDGKPHLRQALLVTVNDEGLLSVAGQPMSIADVRDRIEPGLTTIELAASGKLEYEQVLDVVEALQQAEPLRIDLVVH